MYESKGGSYEGKGLLFLFVLLLGIGTLIGCTAREQRDQNQQNQQKQEEQQNVQENKTAPKPQTVNRENNSHSKRGTKCAQCHVKQGQPVTKEQCSKCHEGMKQLAQKTSDMEPNPHGPHHYDMEDCSICHSIHDKSKMMCAQCHDFPWIKQLGDEWVIMEDRNQ